MSLGLVLFSVFGYPQEQPPNSFVIRVDPPSRRGDLQVYSFITGPFGGVGEYESKPINQDGLFIPTEYEQKPAKTLRAVLYMPGCRIELIRVDNLRFNRREAQFSCASLPTVKLDGRVELTAIHPARDSEVRVQYVAQWSHPFLGIMDGPVVMLDAGSASLESSGRFSIDLPGFALDPLSSDLAKDAYFMLTVRSKRSGEILASLRANEPLYATPNTGDLTIELSYPSPVNFAAR